MRRRNTRDVGGDARLRELERRTRATGAATDAQAYGQALLRAGRVTAPEAALLDRMGAEAWLAWGTGGEAEWRPDEDEDDGEDYADPVEANQLGDETLAEMCADPNGPDCHNDACLLHYGTGPATWRRMTALTGLAVRRHEDGSPMIVRTYWTVDDAENLDSTGEDVWPIGTPHAELAAAQRLQDNVQSWLDYFTWVSERGVDPLDELHLRRGRRLPARKRVREAISWENRTGQIFQRQLLQRWTAAVEERTRLELLARRCAYCNDEIAQTADGAWVGVTGGDACSEDSAPSGVHEPTLRSGDGHLIYDHDTFLFWNNEMGWVDRGSAQRFASRAGVDLPPHGSWVTVADLPNLSHDPECTCMECVHSAEPCEECGGPPDESQAISEHEPDCSQAGQVVCGQHHVCDSLGFDEGAEGENAAAELGEDS